MHQITYPLHAYIHSKKCKKATSSVYQMSRILNSTECQINYYKIGNAVILINAITVAKERIVVLFASNQREFDVYIQVYSLNVSFRSISADFKASI